MGEPHALVVPATGYGHINGSLMLSRALSFVGFKVSFVYFSSTHTQLMKKNLLHDFTHSSIDVHVVEDGRDPDLLPAPPFESNPILEENLYTLLTELNGIGYGITCLVSDSFVPWTQDVADKAQVPRVEFWTSTAFSYLMGMNCEALFNMGIFPEKSSQALWKSEKPITIDQIPGLQPFTSNLYPHELRINSPSVQFCIKLRLYSTRSKCLLVPSVSQLENEAFNALQLAGIQAYSIGPLLHYDAKLENTKHNVDPCISWLNKHPPKSVLYIAFGSQFKLSNEDINEVVHALEESRCPFLWVLVENNLEEILPCGFLANPYGMIIQWAPQFDVLSHPSVCGFLSHCGWNSTVESLWSGVPIIGCPKGAEQFANMHYITNVWGVGFELERTPTGGIEKKGILNCLKKLILEEDGQHAREKAQQVMQLMREACVQGGQSMTNLENFYEEMKTLCYSKQEMNTLVCS